MSASFAALLERDAPADGERPALRCAGSTTSYAGLARDARRAAALLRAHGVRPGDRVALKLPNGAAYVAAYLGALRAGAIVVPLHPHLRPREVRQQLADCDARLLLTATVEDAPPGVECLVCDAQALAGHDGGDGAIAERASGDTALLLYSSGTTGTAKAVELTHGGLAAASAMTAAAMRPVLEDAVVLVAAPICHGYGLGVGLNAPLRTAATLVLLERFYADAALDLVERERAETFLGVPTMFVRMIAAQARRPRDLGSLRTCLSGGGALRPALLHETERALGCEVVEGYGAAEVLRIATNRPGARVAGSVGRALEGVDVRVVDAGGAALEPGAVGEVEVRGASVMKGYWRDPAATAAAIRAGWLRTGDLGRVDRDGTIFLVGRHKDVVIRGGFNVHPSEVEAVLARHPHVAEAAVLGIPDGELGEEIAAAIVLTRECVEPDPIASIEAWLRDEIAPHKRPRVLWAVDALPRGITGKVLRAELRPAAVARHAAYAPAGSK